MNLADEKISKLLERDRVIVFAYDLEGRILVSEGQGLKALGLAPGELVGQSIYHLAHDEVHNIDHIQRALEGESFTAQGGFMGHDLEVQFSPMRDEHERIVGAWGVCVDVSERERLFREKDLLIRAGELLSRSLDYEVTLEHVARLALPLLADYCIVDLAGDDGRLRQVAVAHVDPLKEDRMFELQRRTSFTLDVDYTPYRVLRDRQPLLFAQVSKVMLEAYAKDDDELRLYQALAPRSVLLLPLVSRDRAFGVITLAMSDSGRHYTESDLRLAQTLAQGAARAVHNALLYREASRTAH